MVSRIFKRIPKILLAIALAAPLLSAQTLRSVASRAGILVSTAAAPYFLHQLDYTKTLASQYDMLEAENSMKWGPTEPQQGKFNFRGGDALVAFAEAHDMKVRGHNLLWAKDNPRWLRDGNFTPEQLRQIMREHIMRVAGHYAGKVLEWDVVNEAIDNQGKVGSSIWYDKPGIGLAGKGTAYIAQAFRWAHEADPKALLFYNDYDCAGINAKSDGIYAMVKQFKAEGVPIDGVGFQLHIHLDARGVSTFAKNLARFAKLGVQVQITELDVGLPIGPDRKLLHPSDLEKQAEIYRRVAQACADQPACTAIQTWGFTDRYSWIPGYSRGKLGDALPFDRDYQPKPAFHAMMEVLTKAANDSKVVAARKKFADR